MVSPKSRAVVQRIQHSGEHGEGRARNPGHQRYPKGRRHRRCRGQEQWARTNGPDTCRHGWLACRGEDRSVIRVKGPSNRCRWRRLAGHARLRSRHAHHCDDWYRKAAGGDEGLLVGERALSSFSPRRNVSVGPRQCSRTDSTPATKSPIMRLRSTSHRHRSTSMTVRLRGGSTRLSYVIWGGSGPAMGTKGHGRG